jgi:NAD+ synthase
LRTNARTVADWLGVPLEELSIEAEMRKASVYSSGAAGLTALSGGLNRLLYRIYRVATGEPPFVLSLRAGDVAVPSLEAASREEARADVRRTGGLHRTLVLDAAAGFVARHRYRREVLEAEAKVADCFLLGAANRSEWLTGWFVKGGIDDLPMQPLRGLYKTQVRQLAVALDIPGSVRRAPPSPDMMRGITDELALGMPYPTIDLALDVLAGGVTFQQAAEAGVTARDLRRVQQLVRLSAWKRMPPPGPPAEPSESQSREARVPQPGPPADGGPSGGCD